MPNQKSNLKSHPKPQTILAPISNQITISVKFEIQKS